MTATWSITAPLTLTLSLTSQRRRPVVLVASCRMTAEEPPPAPPDALTLAHAAYASGDFSRLRAEASAAQSSTDADVAKQARELATRVTVDPWTWAVLAACLTLFCAIVVTYAL